ncbi:MAG: sulfur oxidation c-type cytochrome SoxX [Chromatiales bacterium]|nr:sulfur oxidation c-type cytochrome SoxX [Chromatiales bacterium]
MIHAFSRLALIFLVGLMMSGPLFADSADDGKKVAFDRTKGNCLACHLMGDGESPGDIGPPLVAMKARFPDRAKLRAQIWDATVANPESIMLPFGRHHILTEEEIDQVVDYLYTL